jgi:chromosomal replication initiation ATPase DnaA
MTPRERLHERLRMEVCAPHRVTLPALLGSCRLAYMVAARRAAARLLVDDEGLSLPHAGRILNRDHSTVHHLLRHPRQRLDRRRALMEEMG